MNSVLMPHTRHFAIIANPVAHSISPRVYTEAFEKHDFKADFAAVKVGDTNDELASFFQTMREGAYQGIAVSHPFKESCMKFLDEIDPVAGEIGAVNTVVRDGRGGGKLIGYNTDWHGVARAIKVALEENRKKITTLKWKKVVLLGAGGVARAAAYVLRQEGAHVFLVNRTKDHGVSIAEKFGFEFVGDSEQISEGLEPYDIIFQATSVGMAQDGKSCDISPLPIAFWENHGNGIAIESIYHPLVTRFLREAQRAGWDTVTGDLLFAGQWEEQFRLFTGISVEFARIFS